jgi:hypothetical protein
MNSDKYIPVRHQNPDSMASPSKMDPLHDGRGSSSLLSDRDLRISAHYYETKN